MTRTAKTAAALAAVVAALALTGCANDANGTGDAPVAGNAGDSTPAEVYNFPDGFPNVATKCDAYGHRIFVVTHGKTDVPPVVIEDPTCAK